MNRIFAVISVLFVWTGTSFAASLSAGKVSGALGQSVDLPISLKEGGKLSGLQFVLSLPSGANLEAVTATPALAGAGKVVSSRQHGQKTNVLLFGMNRTPLPSGEILVARIRVQKASQKPLNIAISQIAGTDSEGRSIPVKSSQNGSISILP